MKCNKKIRILAVISIILLCMGFTSKVFQNDTFYLIKIGCDILKNGIDLKDHYCWVTNLNYTYPHWLYSVFVGLIYNSFGNLGIYVSTIFLFIVLNLSIYYVNLKTNKDEFMGLIVSLVSCFVLSSFATARGQNVSIIFFFLAVYFIEQLIKTGKNKYIIFLTISSLVIASVHATSWLFLFVLYLPFFVSHIIYLLDRKYKFKINDRIVITKINNIKKLIISFISSFLMGIFTPSHICYTYVFRIMLGNSQKYISEHSALVLIEHPMFLALVIVMILILIFSNVKIYLKELFMMCGLILMCLFSIRHLMFFYTIGVYYLSIMCCRYFKEKNDITFKYLENLISKNNLVYVTFVLVIVTGSAFNFNKNLKNDYIDKSEYPVDAVKYINKNIDKKNLQIYNYYNYGSYMLLNDVPVFVDSRCDLYLKEFNGMKYSIFDDVMSMDYNYKSKFKFYNISYALINKKRIFYRVLQNDNDYKIIYKDKYFVLFERVK